MRVVDRRLLLPACFYLLAALYLAAPVIGSFSTSFLGSEAGDVFKMARHIWWYKSALQGGEDIFEHTLLGYPEGIPATQLWAHPLQFFPSWLFAYVMPLPAAYNLGAILTLFLNGFALFLLARRWLPRQHTYPIFLAGLLYMVFPAMQSALALGQFGRLVQYPVPLFIIFLYDYADLGGSRRLVTVVVVFVLMAAGNSMHVIYVAAPIIGLFMLARLYHRDYVGAVRALTVGLAGCLLLALFLSPVLTESMRRAQAAMNGSLAQESVGLLDIFRPSPMNEVWRHLIAGAGEMSASGASYIGILGGLLALLGIVSRREARWWLLVAMLAWLMALGPVLKLYDQALVFGIAGYQAVVPLPYALLMSVPIIGRALDPYGFMFLFALMFALLAGFGAASFWSSRFVQRRHKRLQGVLAVVICFCLIQDYQLASEQPTVSAAIPEAIQGLQPRRDIRAIYNVPYDDTRAARESLYLQTAHGKPLIAGPGAMGSPVDPAHLELLASFRPTLLNDSNADVVIINKARAEESDQAALLPRARQWLGEPFYEDQRYALFETPFSPDRTAKLHSTRWDGQTHVTYIYKEQPGWMEFRAILEAVNRRVHLSLNGVPLQTLQVNGRIPVSIPLPIASEGYHTLRIALDPPCPERIDTELLLCQSVTVDNVDTQILTNGAIYDPVRIADGIELAGYYLPKQFDDEVAIRLWWRFEADRSNNDVRFVHILDESGLPVMDRPDDRSFGDIAAGSELSETLTVDISALANGEYRVLTGWYELPFAIRYDVLSNVEGAQDDTVVLGAMRVRH